MNRHGPLRFHQRVRPDLPLGECAAALRTLDPSTIPVYRENKRRDGSWYLLCGPDPEFTAVARMEFRPGHAGFVSKGHIHITASDPRRPPAINFNFLSTPPDAELTVTAMRIARSVMTAPAMAPLRLTEIGPGPARQTDDEILDWVNATAETTYHPVGTCKMDGDPMAVVDNRLRVHGLGGVRVADASIMPTLTSGNTNAPSIMIGEKAAEMMLQDAAR